MTPRNFSLPNGQTLLGGHNKILGKMGESNDLGDEMVREQLLSMPNPGRHKISPGGKFILYDVRSKSNVLDWVYIS